MKLEFSGQIFEKSSNIKFYQNSSSGNRVVSCGETDGRTDLAEIECNHNFTLKMSLSCAQGQVCINLRPNKGGH
jgi:hypothetical protein